MVLDQRTMAPRTAVRTVSEGSVPPLYRGCQWSPDKDVELDELMELLDFLIDDGKTNQQNSSMSRLNSGDFPKFFLGQDNLFLTCSYERTHQEVQTNA